MRIRVPAPPRPLWVSLVLAGLLPLGGTGCALSRSHYPIVTAPFGEAVAVFVADGAGDFQGCSRHFRELVIEDRLPMRLEVLNWSHGHCRVVADQVDYPYARAKGVELAHRVMHFRAENPKLPIHLVGHSAGATVVLAALENLPPDVVDRAFLLSPSLSVQYDLRPALQTVRCGLHVYSSRHDYGYLGVGTRLVGNSDRIWGPSGGRYGFRLLTTGPEDADLYSKLNQYEWSRADREAGNQGGHYGFYQPKFVRRHIVPYLLP